MVAHGGSQVGLADGAQSEAQALPDAEASRPASQTEGPSIVWRDRDRLREMEASRLKSPGESSGGDRRGSMLAGGQGDGWASAADGRRSDVDESQSSMADDEGDEREDEDLSLIHI